MEKAALVTAGASGIGRATCLGFAREGAALAVADMNLENAATTAREIRDGGGKGTAISVNVADQLARMRWLSERPANSDDSTSSSTAPECGS
jgi:NAD(P)-dependent dehydrogenase (short-subunit alcohol dehydrogenase family)